MLSIEQNTFLKILSNHLNKEQSVVDDMCDLNLISEYAVRHQMEAIVYYQIHIQELKSAYASTLSAFVNRKKIISSIQAEFFQKKIPFFIIKGVELANEYPHPELRSMVDSDIVVHEEDKCRAHEALLSIGFVCDKRECSEWYYHKNAISIELHHALIYDGVATVEKHKQWADEVWNHSKTKNGVQFYVETEYHLVFLLLHIRKHMYVSGVGYRQFLDLAVLMKQDINWRIIEKYLDELNLNSFAGKCFVFIERWFGIQAPIKGIIDDSFFEYATNRIMNNGVFGFNDASNKKNYQINAIRKYGKTHLFFVRLFPSYEELSKSEKYLFINGRRWLLPVAWIYRFLYAIYHQKIYKGLVNTFGLYIFRQCEFDKMETYLRQWGL